MGETRNLKYRRSQISYSCFGKGGRAVFCFHGYGEDASGFEFLGKYAGDQYTFFAPDLPFHGKTQWKEGLNFTPSDLAEIVGLILQQESARLRSAGSGLPTSDSTFSLLGFSLGGRVALTLYQMQPQRIEKMILMAPDGLKVNFWYWLATQTWPGNKIFGLTMKHPGWFFALLKGLNKLKLVNASIFKFVNYYIGDENVRDLLYRRWTSLRHLKPDLKKIKSSIRENQTPVRLIYGKHDRIILSSVGNKFKKGIEGQCNLSVIHSGHQVLHEKHIGEILPALAD